MFTSIVNWVTFQLLLHIPLWICGSLGLTTLFMSKPLGANILVFVFFAYFAMRYFWRGHLQKQGKLGSASSGLFSLIF